MIYRVFDNYSKSCFPYIVIFNTCASENITNLIKTVTHTFIDNKYVHPIEYKYTCIYMCT